MKIVTIAESINIMSNTIGPAMKGKDPKQRRLPFPFQGFLPLFQVRLLYLLFYSWFPLFSLDLLDYFT